MALRFKKFQPTDYVMAVKNGKTVKKGSGLTLLYNDFYTSILVAPTMAFDGAFAFDDLVTADYQTVCVQGAVTYIIDDYERAVKMADFAYERTYKAKQVAAMNLFCKRINNVIKAIVISETGNREVRAIIKQADDMADFLTEALKKDETLATLGVKILAVNILGITAKPETRKALEAAAREEILKEQDDAIYKRRNAAIEQERIIKKTSLIHRLRSLKNKRISKRRSRKSKENFLKPNSKWKWRDRRENRKSKAKCSQANSNLKERKKKRELRCSRLNLKKRSNLKKEIKSLLIWKSRMRRNVRKSRHLPQHRWLKHTRMQMWLLSRPAQWPTWIRRLSWRKHLSNSVRTPARSVLST